MNRILYFASHIQHVGSHPSFPNPSGLNPSKMPTLHLLIDYYSNSYSRTMIGLYIHIYICTIYIYMCVCVCVYMYIYMCVCIYIYMCVYICIYICMCVYIYI